MSILPKTIYRFNAIHINIPIAFLQKKKKKKAKICIEPQKTLNNQSNLENEVEGITHPDFKLYYKAIVIKAV